MNNPKVTTRRDRPAEPTDPAPGNDAARQRVDTGARQPTQPGAPFLPAPRVPRPSPGWPPAATLEAVAGADHAAGARAVEAARAEATAAVDRLERHRPGPMGTAWRAALAADTDDYTAGRKRGRWRAAELLAGDPDRWADAQVRCRAVATAAKTAWAQLDVDAVKTAAERVFTAAGDRFTATATAGWDARADQAEAWQHRRRGEATLVEYRTARCVWYFADRQGWDDPANTNLFPPDPAAAGCWVALEMLLERTRLIALPAGVRWPVGSEPVVARALGDPASFVAVREHGVHATSHEPVR
jgi:hypothetical protein